MAIHLSTVKRARQSQKRRLRNRMVKSGIKTAEKKVHQTQDSNQAQANLSKVSSLLDRAASKGILHRRRVDRHKSRLARSVNRLKAASGLSAAEKK